MFPMKDCESSSCGPSASLHSRINCGSCGGAPRVLRSHNSIASSNSDPLIMEGKLFRREERTEARLIRRKVSRSGEVSEISSFRQIR